MVNTEQLIEGGGHLTNKMTFRLEGALYFETIMCTIREGIKTILVMFTPSLQKPHNLALDNYRESAKIFLKVRTLRPGHFSL